MAIEWTARKANADGWENAPLAFSNVSRLEILAFWQTMELVVLFVLLLGLFGEQVRVEVGGRGFRKRRELKR